MYIILLLAKMVGSFYNFFSKTDSFQLFSTFLKQFRKNCPFGKQCIGHLGLKRHLSEEKKEIQKKKKGERRGGGGKRKRGVRVRGSSPGIFHWITI